MYFWLNYCDKSHIERIPIAVKGIDHLFNEIIKVTVFICFCFLTAPELMIRNT